jgi:hypothetical protein
MRLEDDQFAVIARFSAPARQNHREVDIRQGGLTGGMPERRHGRLVAGALG